MKKLAIAATVAAVFGMASAPTLAKYHGEFGGESMSSGLLQAEADVPKVCGINIQQGEAIIGFGEEAKSATPIKMQIGANFHGEFTMNYDFDLASLVKANGNSVSADDIEVKFEYQQYHKGISNSVWQPLASIEGDIATKVNSAAYGEGYMYFRFVGDQSQWLAGTQTMSLMITMDCEG